MTGRSVREWLSRPSPLALSSENDLEQEVLAVGCEFDDRPRSVKAAQRAAHDRAMAIVSSDPQLRAARRRCSGWSTRRLSASATAISPSTWRPTSTATMPPPFALDRWAADSRAFGRASGRIAVSMVRQMAGRFIVGESVTDAEPVLGGLWRQG